MKKTMLDLSSIKSRCFMLMVGLGLLLGTTSCNNEDFEDKVPDQPKELSKAELIEAALSRIPQTRAGAPFPVIMVTSNKTVTIRCQATEDMMIHWDDGSTTPIIKNTSNKYTHTYSDDKPSHGIFLQGSNQAITNLIVEWNDLIYLNVTNNTELISLNCSNNQLDELDLTGCSNLRFIEALYNHLSSIDVTHLPDLEVLDVPYNRITSIDVSKNPKLSWIVVNKNKITELDLSNNTALTSIAMSHLPINTFNNLPLSNNADFSIFPKLQHLNITNVPFTSLDLSRNSSLGSIHISGTAITQLDISNVQVRILDATNSKLTNLIYTSSSLLYVEGLEIQGTPFEMLSSNLYPFLTALPDRNLPNQYGSVVQGLLITNSSALIAPLLSYLTAKNWVVNPTMRMSMSQKHPFENRIFDLNLR